MFKAFALLLTLAAAAVTVPAQTLALDAATSSLAWTGHAEVGTYSPSGTLAVKEGQISFANGNFTGANMIVDMRSLSQSNADLTHHLKGPDFFDVDKFPTSTVHIDRIDRGTVFGTITIKNKSTPFESPVRVKADSQHFTLTGRVQLDRTKYGITYNSTGFFSGLGNKAIRDTFEVDFTLSGTGFLPEKYRQ